MNLQELIAAVIDKIRQLSANDVIAREIAKADSGIYISAEIKGDGEPTLEQLHFVSKRGDIYVTPTLATYFTGDDDVYGTQLCVYNNWNDLLGVTESE
jgi:hypothetical protein